MMKNLQNMLIGSSDDFDLEHRCYNGVCLTAAFGCLAGAAFNAVFGIPLPITLVTLTVGLIYLWLYLKSRDSRVPQPILWLYILNGIGLLVMTWLFNGGINGAGIYVSMVALVAMIVVLKRRRFLVVATVFLPTMSALFLTEYFYPELITGYRTLGQRFLDVYLTLVVATVVISLIVGLILQSHHREKKRLGDLNRRLAELATKDSLTKVFNRRRCQELLEAEMERSKRYTRTFSLMIFDLDHFKRVNDTHGHHTGDVVLMDVSSIVGENIRKPDILARWGGEEFIIISPETDLQEARQLAEKLRRLIENHRSDKAPPITASFGVAEYISGESPEDLIRRADRALYQAKEKGRNRTAVIKGA